MEVKRQVPGQVEINFSFSRHLGPRWEYASVRLQFGSSEPYTFSSSAEWPEADNYEAFVKAGVEQALQESQGSLQKTSVKLVAIGFDSVDSTPNAFKKAAYAATYAAFLT